MIVKTKRGIHILDGDKLTIKTDYFISPLETKKEELKTLKEDSLTLYLSDNICETIKTKKMLHLISDNNYEVNGDIICEMVILEKLNIKSHITTKKLVIKNSKINELVIDENIQFLLIKNCEINDLKFLNLSKYKSSIHIEDSIINSIINFPCLENEDTTIFIKNNKIIKDIFFDKIFKAAITFINNNFINSTIYIDYEYLELKDNIGLDLNNIKYMLYTGYKKELVNPNILNNDFASLKPYTLLNVSNIGQYESYDNDKALQTGCEATAIAVALSYILNKKITKNEIASFMPQDINPSKSFWESFIGDIYNDGWGTMSPVSVYTIRKYLEANNLQNDYEVLNTTNTPLYVLLKEVEQNRPVIVWSTMGNDKTMYYRKYGSTKWNINNETLYWPGNDHSVVIIGYNLNKDEIYLADPEASTNQIRTRNIYTFEHRFTELYSQSIIIKKRIN